MTKIALVLMTLTTPNYTPVPDAVIRQICGFGQKQCCTTDCSSNTGSCYTRCYCGHC